jgi:alpha-L-fucosidase 2
VEAALGLDTRVLRERHVRDHQELFARCDLDLSASAERHPEAAQAELYFDLGRYLLVAGSRRGSQPLNLQGIWNADVRPAWSSNLTTNINAPMNYWGAEPTGLGDLHAPLLDLVGELLVAGRETAQRLYGARGSCVHHNTDLWRFTDPVPGLPQWVSWPAALWWLASHVVQHHAFLAPGPEAESVLRRRVLPVLRACAEFALDMLVPHTDGDLVVSPSSSPEHAFVVDGAPFAVTWGSAMDQELVHEVLTRTVELLGHHGDEAADGALVVEAREALSWLRLPAVIDGRIAEWADDLDPEEPGHRHLSHLYGLFPGSRLTRQGSADERAAARAALDLRLAEGSGYTGWSQAWVLCLAARLRDRELAERSVATLVGPLSSRSLLDLHPLEGWPGGAVFQIDGNLGAVAGIAELLVQSHAGAIVVLPAVPRTWPSGKVRGLRARGGHVVDVLWDDGVLTHAVVHAGASGEVVVDLPTADGGRGRRTVRLYRGESVTVTSAGVVAG